MALESEIQPKWHGLLRQHGGADVSVVGGYFAVHKWQLVGVALGGHPEPGAVALRGHPS